MTAPARFIHGTTVTATHPVTKHSVTGRWNANYGYLEFEVDGGHYRIPLSQLQGCTFATAEEARTA